MNDRRTEKRGLGRGLSALMAEVQVDRPRDNGQVLQGKPGRAEVMVPIERLIPNPDQPRRDFVPEALEELAASIREKGVIQPLIVRARDEDRFEIVAGERRWRAAQIAQLHELPVLVRDFSDTEVLEVAIIENIQRADLNAVEEALAYRQLMDRFGHTQEKLAEALGKSRSHIANLLRMLNLPDQVLGLVRSGAISAGHARALVTSDHAAEIARQIVAKGLSVRETERLTQAPKAQAKARQARDDGKDADTRALESDLSATLRMKVQIDHRPGQDGGSLTVTYRSLDDLDMLCRMLSAMPQDGSI